MIQLFWDKKEVCKIDPDILVEKAPNYRLPFNSSKRKKEAILMKEGERKGKENKLASESISTSKSKPALTSTLDSAFDLAPTPIENLTLTLIKILKSPSACSRNFIFDQFDKGVGGKTVKDTRESVSVLRLPHSGRLLGLILGGRPHIMRFSPRVGGLDSVFYPHLELSSKGFKGLAITDCLNFADPENEDVMGEFVSCVEAISDACKALNTPVISGNVSFYNETKNKKSRITSTPAIGIVGLKDRYETDKPLPSSFFSNEGDEIFLLECFQLKVEGIHEEFKKEINNKDFFNLKDLSKFSNWIQELLHRFPISSSRVVGKLGVLYSLARMS